MILTVTIECDVDCPEGFDESLVQDAVEMEIESMLGYPAFSSISVEDDSDEDNPYKSFNVRVSVT